VAQQGKLAAAGRKDWFGPMNVLDFQKMKNDGRKVLAGQARELQDAGCLSLVFECVPSEAAWKVKELLKYRPSALVPARASTGRSWFTRMCSASTRASNQKFLRTYANTFGLIRAALNAYDRDVKEGYFPSDSESYEVHLANLQLAKHAA
jgi:3-methyl-2-oxobutanoate hydroxymethyltransferase